MKIFTKILGILLVVFAVAGSGSLQAQSVLDPTDTMRNYNSAAPPTQPAFGTIGKWVRTSRLNWNTSLFKAYIYKQQPFRLKFPKTYNPTAVDNKKYPMLVFFHGMGEGASTIYDNEYQLYHGGQGFSNAVENGTFDGYVLCMQTGGGWGNVQFDAIRELINYMVTNNKLDPFQVITNGLSGGAQGTWEMFLNNPTYISAVLPMSGVYAAYTGSSYVNKMKYTPVWNFHGGVDGNPAPYTAYQVRDAVLNAGGNYKNTMYPTLGHGVWGTVWNEPDFWPFIKRSYSANPWALFGRTEFCPGDPINVTIGLVAGFDQYEWRKDGVVIPGATGNTIQVTSLGTYDARVRRGSNWSDYSRTPVVIKIKTPTVTPPITVNGLMSKVIPAPDGNTGVTLSVPDGYASYVWQKVGSATTIGTDNLLNATTPGDYQVKVTEQFGCSSSFGAPFKVVDANGPNKPDAAINVIATTLSKTAIKLDWSDNPTPTNNETNFEVYQATQSGGPYKLVAITGADVLTATISNLNAKTNYFYKVRAVNNSGAAASSNEAAGTTDADVQPPTAPTNLAIVTSSRTSISLSWSASSDDVGVTKYEVYINGEKAYVTTATSFVVNSLQEGTSYTFTVKAKDFAGNESPFSNQASSQPVFKGLNYKYYENNGTAWTALPNFGTLTPLKTGNSATPDINVRNRDENFAILWEGLITVPANNIYTFRTRSDDGSRLWLGAKGSTASPYVHGTSMVNNDGAHGEQDRDGSAITLTAGVYPIAIAYYNGAGGKAMKVSWKTFGGGFLEIPATAYTDAPVNNGSAPAAPSSLVATAVSFKQINLTWTDNSSNETGFEIYRSNSLNGPFVTVGNAAANATSYADSTLSAGTAYYYRVKAIGQYGQSDFDTRLSGMTYKYYENDGTPWTVLPNWSTLTPKTVGRVGSFTLTGTQERADNFGIVYDGWFNLPIAASVIFYTNSNEGSKLYIDGFDESNLVVSNDGIHSATEKFGTKSLTAGWHRIVVTYFERTTTESLIVSYKIGSASKTVVPASALSDPYAGATTLALPGVPAAPTALVATGISKSSIQLNWADNADNETAFELFRSSNNNANFILVATLPANTTSYVDTGLFANSVQYYKIRAAGVGGKSAYTNEANAQTLNGTPVIVDINNRSVRYGVSTVVAVAASDADGDALSFTGLTLPAFASLTDNGNKTASLTLNPSAAQQGNYNISIKVSDTHGGADTTTFALVVNDNFDPVIGSIPNYTISENGSQSINLTATDQNAGDVLTFAVSNLPNAYTLTPGGNGAATLQLNPGYAAAGTYNVNVTVTDGNGGSAVKTFTLTVNDVTPQATTIRAAFRHQTTVAAPWNNITGITTSNLKDQNGNTTTVGIQMPNWWSSWNEGPQTGNNSGVYPDAVMKEYYFFGSYPGIFSGPETVTGKVTGLDVNKKYDLSFYAGSVWSVLGNNGTTTFNIGSQTINLNVQNNTQNTAAFSNLSPAADGTITFTVGKAAGTQVGYLGAIVINSLFDDGTAPAAPKSLIVSTVSEGVQLNWQDVAYNEAAYEIYRSTTEAGTYAKVGDAASNTGSFTDANVNGNTHYYYKVRAINGVGNSDYSNVADVATVNVIPTIDAIANVTLKNNQQTTVNVVTHDDATDVVTLSVAGLPSFATFIDNGNGTGTININPNGAIGNFTGITVTATDAANATRTESFDIAVQDKDVTSVYVNFTDGVISAAKPWNNFTAQPFSGASLTNLKDDGDQNTGISVTLVNGFQWYVAGGMRSNEGKAIFPDNVVRTHLYEGSTNTRTIRVAGLSQSKRYNFVFFNSHEDGFKGLTNFTVNGTTVSLNGTYNQDKTVQINGITPDASGQVNIAVQKAAGQDYAYLNAMIIQVYEPATELLSPTELRIQKVGRNSIALQWQDRSSDETGFEIWRANSSNGAYSLVTTVPANSQTYTDAGLTTNATYYYTVRAVNVTNQSGYTSAVKATTYPLNIYVNYANANESGLPWYNTKTNPQQDYVWSNIYDEQGIASNVGMEITQNFAGLYSAGVQTGNNSGLYPDKVMFDSYGLFPGETGKYKMTGLNMAMTYDFTFFGSTTVWGDVNTSWEINGKVVMLNTSVNSSGTVTISGVRPDENGEVAITVRPGTPTSQFGLLGAMVLQGYNAPATDELPALPAGNNMVARVARTIASSATVADQIQVTETAPGALNVYPNPFRKEFTLSVPATANEKLDVQIFDVAGRMVYNKQFSALNQGMNILKIDASTNMTRTGAYMVRITYLGSGVSKTVKLVKE